MSDITEEAAAEMAAMHAQAYLFARVDDHTKMGLQDNGVIEARGAARLVTTDLAKVLDQREKLVKENAQLKADAIANETSIRTLGAVLERVRRIVAAAEEYDLVSALVLRDALNTPLPETLVFSPHTKPTDILTPPPSPSSANALSAALAAIGLMYPPKRPPLSLLLTPELWCRAYGVIVLDPDGWRGPVDPKPWHEPINIVEFYRRAVAGHSTCDLTNPAWEGIAKDAHLAETESGGE